MLCFAMLAVMVLDSGAPMKITRQWQSPDEVGDAFLQDPADAAFDSKGGLYVLDVVSRRIFVWSPEGKFVKAWGKEGNGPGEFVFSRNSNGRVGRTGNGALSCLNDQIFVYDRRKAEVMIFDTQFKLLKTLPFRVQGSRLELLWAVAKDRFLVSESKLEGRDFVNGVNLLGPDFKPVSALANAKDLSRKLKGAPPPPGGGGPPGSGRGNRPDFALTAFGPRMSAQFDSTSGKIIVGYSDKPAFQVFDRSGKLQKTVTMSLPQKEVGEADIKEYKAGQDERQGRRPEVVFPKTKAYFDIVMPLRSGAFLVFSLSPTYRTIEGYLVDDKGKLIKPIRHKLGEAGNLFSKQGHLLAVQTNDDGDYIVQELLP